jgi:hypothetical protein
MVNLSFAQRIGVCLLPREPFPDIGRTISEFHSARFPEGEEFYALPIDQKHTPQIDDHWVRFLLEQRSKQIRGLPGNVAADIHDHNSFPRRLPVDFAGHLACTPRLRISKTFAKCNVVKTKRKSFRHGVTVSWR